MGAQTGGMDRIPAEPQLFIGGLDAVDDINALEAATVSHILSILEYDHCDWPEYKIFKRKVIIVEDEVDENLLLHFEEANTFLGNALLDGGTVLVHCGEGDTRSAAFLCAFFMRSRGVTASEALAMVRKGRQAISPNDRFMVQLEVYSKLLPFDLGTLEYDRIYEIWAAQDPPADTRPPDQRVTDDDSESDEVHTPDDNNLGTDDQKWSRDDQNYRESLKI